MRETWEDPQGRKFILGTAAIVVVGVLILLLTHVFGGGGKSTPDDAPQKNGTTISDDQKTIAKNTVVGFVNSAGKWGAIADNVDANNIMNVRYLISGDQSEAATTYYISRPMAYKQTRNLYIPKVSSLWYEDSVADGWQDAYAADNIIGMQAKDVKVGDDGYASQITLNSNNLTTYTTSVKFTERETKYIQSSDDSSWDGTFNIMSKDFTENATITLVQINNEWKVYTLQGLIDPFVFDTWNTPSDGYGNSQFGMTQVGSLKAKKG